MTHYTNLRHDILSNFDNLFATNTPSPLCGSGKNLFTRRKLLSVGDCIDYTSRVDMNYALDYGDTRMLYSLL